VAFSTCGGGALALALVLSGAGAGAGAGRVGLQAASLTLGTEQLEDLGVSPTVAAVVRKLHEAMDPRGPVYRRVGLAAAQHRIYSAVYVILFSTRGRIRVPGVSCGAVAGRVWLWHAGGGCCGGVGRACPERVKSASS
jgi:uncharacterized membrane protein